MALLMQGCWTSQIEGLSKQHRNFSRGRWVQSQTRKQQRNVLRRGGASRLSYSSGFAPAGIQSNLNSKEQKTHPKRAGIKKAKIENTLNIHNRIQEIRDQENLLNRVASVDEYNVALYKIVITCDGRQLRTV